MKKINVRLLAVGLVTGFLNNACAGEPIIAEAIPESGFYVGAGVGIMGLQNDWTTANTITILDAVNFSDTTATNADGTGFNSTFLAGYAWYTPQKFFLGAEAFGNITNTTSSVSYVHNTNLSTDTSLTQQSVYGIRALPGYQVRPNIVVYGIGGWARSHAKSNVGLTYTNDAPEVDFSDSTTGSADFDGYQLGMGSMINITKNVLLRADVIYTGYGTETLGSNSNTMLGGGTSTMDVTANPSTWEGDLSLVYLFGH